MMSKMILSENMFRNVFEDGTEVVMLRVQKAGYDNPIDAIQAAEAEIKVKSDDGYKAVYWNMSSGDEYSGAGLDTFKIDIDFKKGERPKTEAPKIEDIING